MKRTVMTTAWDYLKQGIFTSISEALKAAWKAIKIKLALAQGIVEFQFVKANGEIRDARGTTSNEYFEYTPCGGREPKSDVIVYYDIDKGSFRSFRIERLIG